MTSRSSRWIGTLVVAIMGLAACTNSGPADVGAAPTRTEPTEAATPDTSTAEPVLEAPSGTGTGTGTGTVATAPGPAHAATTEVEVYLLRGETLERVRRRVPKVPAIGEEAVTSLLGGPSRTEATAGLGTAIPAGTKLLGLVIERGTATVDLSRTFESGGGTLGMTLRLAQVTCTLDQFDSVTGVRFALAGKLISVFSGEGIVLDRPVTCSSYRDHLGGGGGPKPAPPAITCTPPPGGSCGPRPGSPPALAASPTAAEPGQEIVASVSRFRPRSSVVVELVRQQPYEVALTFDLATDGVGSASQRFLVPGPALPGDHLLIATSADRTQTATSRIVVLRSSSCAPDQQPTC